MLVTDNNEVKNKRLPMGAFLPCRKAFDDVSLNIHRSSYLQCYRRKVWGISHFLTITGAKVAHLNKKSKYFGAKCSEE